jgi:hypothetical protein
MEVSMASYTLNINIDPQDVATIYDTTQRITLVKQSASDRQALTVAWLALEAANHTTVEWKEAYALYTCTEEVEEGAKITQSTSQDPAQDNKAYLFKDNRLVLDNLGSAPGVNKYRVKNDPSETEYIFGLAQSAAVNGGVSESQPLNAVKVLHGQTATFTPIEKIFVFLSGTQNNGVIISEVDGDALVVDFTQTPSATINYNPSNAQFTLAS